MTHDDCGCRCRDCAEHDIHSCGLSACTFGKYRAMTKPVEHLKPAETPPILRAQFRSIRDQASKARLSEWARFCHETAGLEFELREAKRRERHAEIFGGA